MAQLSDNIERFIIELMDGANRIELRRNELAQHFGCAPSQINYVLATRFTIARGYIIDSRRGEGGYVRIVQMRTSGGGESLLPGLMDEVGAAISEAEATDMIRQLLSLGLITDSEAGLMVAATGNGALAIPLSTKDVLRASVLRALLVQVFRKAEGANLI